MGWKTLYYQENRTSRRPFLLLRISFRGRPIYTQFIPEACGEDGDEGVDLAQPHRDQPEEDGADDGGEEASPVVPHGEEHRRYLSG